MDLTASCQNSALNQIHNWTPPRKLSMVSHGNYLFTSPMAVNTIECYFEYHAYLWSCELRTLFLSQFLRRFGNDEKRLDQCWRTPNVERKEYSCLFEMEMVLLSSGRLIDGFGIVDANSALLRKICNLHASHSEFRFPELISELKGAQTESLCWSD